MAEMSNEDILEAIKQKTVLELNELVTMIQDEFGVTPMAMAAPAVGPAAAAEEEMYKSCTYLPRITILTYGLWPICIGPGTQYRFAMP